MAFLKERLQKLAGITNPQMLTESARPYDDEAKKMIHDVPAYLRAIHLWFHGAHHTTRGADFAGDHAYLYTRIYTEVQDEVDGAIEKAIGVTGEQRMACPKCLTEHAVEILGKYANPPELEPRDIAKEGLHMIEDYISMIEHTFKVLESKGMLTLGMDDQLAASANTHETYVYLLKQRVRSYDDVSQNLL